MVCLASEENYGIGEENLGSNASDMHFSKSVPDGYDLCDGVGTRGYTDLVKPLLGSGTYAELMDATKMKYEGGLYM